MNEKPTRFFALHSLSEPFLLPLCLSLSLRSLPLPFVVTFKCEVALFFSLLPLPPSFFFFCTLAPLFDPFLRSTSQVKWILSRFAICSLFLSLSPALRRPRTRLATLNVHFHTSHEKKNKHSSFFSLLKHFRSLAMLALSLAEVARSLHSKVFEK